MKQQHIIIGWSLLMLALATTAMAQKEERNFIRRGNRQYTDSAFVNADVSYRKAIEANPSSAIAMYNLGNTLTQQNKLEDAMKMYVDASKLETNKERLGQIYHNMGVILQSQKEYAKAIEAYKQSLRNEPHSNETKYNLALAQKMLKDQQQQQQNQDQQQQNKQQNQQQQNQNQQQDNKDQQQQEDQQQNQQQQQQDEKMSKENAEQLLRSVMQDEKDVQEKVKKQQVLQGGKLLKDW